METKLCTAMNTLVTVTPLDPFSTKTAYSTLLDKSFLAPTAENRILNHGFTKDNICNIYMLPFHILKEPKLIMFQIKIIQNTLPTQSSLFRSRITNNETCPLCNLENQTLLQMLLNLVEVAQEKGTNRAANSTNLAKMGNLTIVRQRLKFS